MNPEVTLCRTGPLAWAAPQSGQELCSIYSAEGNRQTEVRINDTLFDSIASPSKTSTNRHDPKSVGRVVYARQCRNRPSVWSASFLLRDSPAALSPALNPRVHHAT